MADGGSATQAWRRDDLDAVRQLLACDVADLTEPELGDWLVTWSGVAGRLEARAAAVAARWDAQQVWAGDAARSGAGWLAARTEWNRSQAAEVVTFGRRLREQPVVSEAFGSGRIGAAKARLLLRAARFFPERFALDGSFLVDQIAPLTADAARVAVATWMRLADQEASSRPDPEPDTPGPADAARGDDGTDPGDHDGDAPSEETAPDSPLADVDGVSEERSRWTMAHTTGGWLTKATFDTATGAVIDQAITAELDTMYRAGIARPADGWTPAERKAFALTELVRRGSLPSTRHGSPKPLVVAVADLHLLADPPPPSTRTRPGTDPGVGSGDRPRTDTDLEIGAGDAAGTNARAGKGTGMSGGVGVGTGAEIASDRRGRAGPQPGRLPGRCEIVGAGPIAVETLRRLACDGDIVRVIRGADSEILDVGRTARLATPAQRRALLIRDGGCIAPGCTTPPEHCEAHHIVEYDHGGGTDLANLALLCRFHHHRYHEGGHHIRRRPDGTLEFRRPDGTLHATAPPGHKLPTNRLASVPRLAPPAEASDAAPSAPGGPPARSASNPSRGVDGQRADERGAPSPPAEPRLARAAGADPSSDRRRRRRPERDPRPQEQGPLADVQRRSA